MEYCSPLCAGAPAYHLSRLHAVETKAFRIIGTSCGEAESLCLSLSQSPCNIHLVYPVFPPRLEILEQPRQRGQRFRYECEGRSAGSILGENSTEQHKTYTAVLNYAGRVRLVMSLLTHEPPFRPHPHSLVGKNCEDGVCILELDPPNLYVQFQNLGIQCVKRKHVFDAIKQRLIRRIDPYNVGGRALKMENLHMNAVRLCWQAYLLDNHGNVLRALPPVLSNPIYDKRTNTSELRISRLNINHGSVAGGDECFILCDKVQKGGHRIPYTAILSERYHRSGARPHAASPPIRQSGQ
uniref:V-rel avian reticuloendotheliosis viral oncogene homolog n=1 Tax=Eptatretus burgeri TaxID=7764 RepID=A0A8C4R0H3_EPTBU